MDPQRIPPEYWRDRLSKARAMGLNTIFSYVFWNLLEPQQGHWESSNPANNIAKFFRIAQEEGLHVVLRPGPYICGEREWGGFPSWLTQTPGLIVRDYNRPFLDAAESYITNLAADLGQLQVTHGGPILMVQVENEYGSYGDEHNYTMALKKIVQEKFDTVLYTNDGGVNWTLLGGQVPGTLAEVDGDPTSGFKSRLLWITDPSELGPLLDGEYYTWAPDQWGSYNTHNTTAGDPSITAQFVKDLDYVLGNESASISLYMVHGGTNFGFGNGALWQNRTTVFTTSYDYGSPIDEAGRINDLWHNLRNTIAKHLPQDSLPDIPQNVPLMDVEEFSLEAATSLFDFTFNTITSDSPLTMEALNQSYGYVLYEHTATTSVYGTFSPGDRARDRVLIYVNDARVGVIDSQYQHPPSLEVSLAPGDKLRLLVENLGRVDYYSRGNSYANHVIDPYKGIVGVVTIGNTALSGWNITSIPLDDISSLNFQNSTSSGAVGPNFYRGVFSVDVNASGLNASDPRTMDTYLAVPNGIKGVVWVNGFNLGRYWMVGPQQSLYLPGSVISAQEENEVIVLELEPELLNKPMVAEGMSDRVWGNNPDLDCLRCI